jgi:hypothetical protein
MSNIGAQDWLQSGVAASATGAAMDCRNCQNAAYHTYWTVGNSAVLTLEASPNGLTGWMNIATVTATTSQASAQLTTFFPFVRGGFSTGWTNATAYQHYSPVMALRYG